MAQAAEFYVGAEALTTAFLDASTKLACLENIGVCRVELQDYAAAQQAWTTGAGLATTLGDHRLCRRMF